MANNIVDAVNQNAAKAYQQAVLARILGGAQANPVMGGVNQAQTPDLTTNAIVETQQAPVAKLLGARVPQFDGGAGGSGLAAGIGNALTNMYNSRIARSEQEVADAAADKRAKQAAEQSGIDFKNKKEMKAYEESFLKGERDANIARDQAATQKIYQDMGLSQARFDRAGTGGGSVQTGSAPVNAEAEFYVANPQTGELEFNEAGVKVRIANLWNSKNGKDRKEALQLKGMLDRERNNELKQISDLEKERDRLQDEQVDAPTPGKARRVAEMTNEINARKNKRRNTVVAPNAPQGNVGQATVEIKPAGTSLLEKAALLGKPQPPVQMPQAPVPETFANPQPELLY